MMINTPYSHHYWVGLNLRPTVHGQPCVRDGISGMADPPSSWEPPAEC